jgi:hypothetical protein
MAVESEPEGLWGAEQLLDVTFAMGRDDVFGAWEEDKASEEGGGKSRAWESSDIGHRTTKSERCTLNLELRTPGQANAKPPQGDIKATPKPTTSLPVWRTDRVLVVYWWCIDIVWMVYVAIW